MKAESDQMSEENEEMKNQLAQIEAEKTEAEAEKVVLEAIEKGQYEPAVKDLKVAQYKENKEWILKELEAIPVKENRTHTLTAKTVTGNADFSAEDREIMLSLNMNPDDAEERKAFLNDTK